MPATTEYSVIESPLGELRLALDGGALGGLYMPVQKGSPAPKESARPDPAVLKRVSEQLDAYFAGTLRKFDLELSPRGTEFQRRVWDVLLKIPFGETISYGEVARRIGAPSAVRAVGLAIGRNPIGIIVPCHRVVGARGDLTGYAGGLENKRWLLEHEGAGVGPIATNRPTGRASR